MLKKILVATLLVGSICTSAFADIEVGGQIIEVNDANKTITLSGMQGNIVVQIFPHTELKGDDCGLGGLYDTRERFTALRSGMFVKVEGYPQAGNVIGAKEVEWQCGKRAY